MSQSPLNITLAEHFIEAWAEVQLRDSLGCGGYSPKGLDRDFTRPSPVDLPGSMALYVEGTPSFKLFRERYEAALKACFTLPPCSPAQRVLCRRFVRILARKLVQVPFTRPEPERVRSGIEISVGMADEVTFLVDSKYAGGIDTWGESRNKLRVREQ